MLIQDVETFLSYSLDERCESKEEMSFEAINSLNDLHLIDRFKICINDSKDSIIDKMKFAKRDLDYDSLKEKLQGTSLELYTIFLIKYQNQYISAQEAKKYVAEMLYKNYRDKHLEEIRYTDLLLFIQDKLDLSYGINITFTNVSRKKKEIRDCEYLKYIFDATKQYYIDKEYNTFNPTYDEALEKLRNPLFVSDLEQAYSSKKIDKNKIDIENIPNEVVEYFRNSITIKKEINEELLIAKKEKLEGYLKILEEAINPGRKFINQQVARFALNLSYLIRLERFIKQDEVDNIFDMKFMNKDLELIYDYVLFWGMKNKEDIGSGYTNVDNWIKTYKRQNPDSRNNINVKRINELRRKLRE